MDFQIRKSIIEPLEVNLYFMDPINQNPMNQPVQPVQVQHHSSKKGLYIIIAILVLIILAFLFRGSLGFTRSYNVAGINGEVTKNLDGTTTVKSDYGTMTTANTMPANWPSDAPTYKNATITSSMVIDPTYSGTSGSTLTFTTSDTPQTVVDFYKTQLAAEGWTVMGNGSTMGAMTVLSARKDSRMLSLGVTNGSKVNVTVSITTIPNTTSNSQSAITGGTDSQKKSILSEMRAQGELFYATNSNSYKGYCGSKGQNGAYQLAVKLPPGTNYKCNDSSSAWAAGADISAGGSWCVDASGYTGQAKSVPTGTSCAK